MATLSDEDIRYFLADQQVQDHSLELDLAFSTKEIAAAKKRTAASYNSIPPLIHNIRPQDMNSDTDIFLFGLAYHLYLSKRMELASSDIDFSAGGVTTNIVTKRLNHIDRMLPEFYKRFREGVHAFKLTKNRHNTFGQVG